MVRIRPDLKELIEDYSTRAIEDYKKDNPVCTFFHNEDDYTLTSTGWIWAYPGKLGSLRTVAVMPENYMTEVTFFDAVCSDYVERYKDGKIVTI